MFGYLAHLCHLGLGVFFPILFGVGLFHGLLVVGRVPPAPLSPCPLVFLRGAACGLVWLDSDRLVGLVRSKRHLSPVFILLLFGLHHGFLGDCQVWLGLFLVGVAVLLHLVLVNIAYQPEPLSTF